MAHLMPLPLTLCCFSKIQIGFTCLVPAHPGSPRQGAVKRVCVCVYCIEIAINAKPADVVLFYTVTSLVRFFTFDGQTLAFTFDIYTDDVMAWKQV